MNIWPYISQLFIQFFGGAVSVLMRLIPQRYRFGFATAIMRLFPYYLRHTLSLRMERMPSVSSVREAILSVILEAMDCRKIRFNPAMNASGLELFREALQEGRGVLLIGTHTNGALSRVALRLLYDAEMPLTVISIRDPYAVCGTGLAIPTIYPAGSFMIKVRTELRSARVVCAMIDAFKQSPKRTLQLRTPNGSIWVSDSLIRLGLACNATIIFVAARLDSAGSLAFSFQAASEVRTPEDCWQHLVLFFEKHMRGANNSVHRDTHSTA